MLQDKEKLALTSLNQISDYAQYIDSRIIKLNMLYQSLNLDKRVRPKSKQFRNDFVNPKLYETVKQTLKFPRKRTPSILQSMHNTQYFPKKERYSQFGGSNYKSINYSEQRSESYRLQKDSQYRDTIKSIKRVTSKNNSDKLKEYQNLKMNMLGTFYVGGRTLKRGHHFYQSLHQAENGQRQSQFKLKRGKLWHGRPPVKIVQRFQ